MLKNISTKSIVIGSIVGGFLLATILLLPLTSQAILVTSPPRIIVSGDVTTVEILNGTILGEDIFSGASTTMFRLQVSDLSATSTVATSTFLGGLSVASNFFVLQNGNVAVGTTSPNATFEVAGTLAGTVGGFSSGNFHVTNNSTTEFANSVITGHNYFSNNTQLWYLGNTSSSNNNVAFINRQSGTLQLHTNNLQRLTILAGGNVGIGTTSPFVTLGVAGEVVADIFTATSTTATSTFDGGLKLNLANSGIEFQDGTIQTTLATGQFSNWERIIATSSACATAAQASCTVSVTCTGTREVLGGGILLPLSEPFTVLENYPSATNEWTIKKRNEVTAPAHTIAVFAICADTDL